MSAPKSVGILANRKPVADNAATAISATLSQRTTRALPLVTQANWTEPSRRMVEQVTSGRLSSPPGSTSTLSSLAS